MTKEKLLAAFQASLEKQNPSHKKFDKVFVTTDNGNDLYIDKVPVNTGGLYLGDIEPNYLIGIIGLEKFNITKKEYEGLVELFNQFDTV
jgi:hypothetical protein